MSVAQKTHQEIFYGTVREYLVHDVHWRSWTITVQLKPFVFCRNRWFSCSSRVSTLCRTWWSPISLDQKIRRSITQVSLVDSGVSQLSFRSRQLWFLWEQCLLLWSSCELNVKIIGTCWCTTLIRAPYSVNPVFVDLCVVLYFWKLIAPSAVCFASDDGDALVYRIS